jgi:hypothetical protein
LPNSLAERSTKQLALDRGEHRQAAGASAPDELANVGDALLVRNGGREERIALADIKNVNYSPYMSPPQVTLSLRRPTLFGDTIVFCAPTRLMPMSSSPIIEKLIDRVDVARREIEDADR